jgi:hypothetical protein
LEKHDFHPRRVTRSYRQTICADPETVFPLLCPVREVEWLDGWQYEMIYSESGLAEEGAVFSTSQSGEEDTIWMVTRHEPASMEVQFARFTHRSRTCLLNISVHPKGAEQSFVDITYSYTGLSNEGNEFVDTFTREAFLEAITFWEKSMNHFLRKGERLKKHSRQ